MIVLKHRTARSAGAVATLVGAMVLASPLFAASSEMLPKASSQQQAMASRESGSAGMTAVEARIMDLHKKLHITAAQKPQWDNLTQVMRENAQTMMDLQKQRAADASAMSAVDVVKSYESVIEAHEKGMEKFIPPFQALYDSMSDAQKKTADSLFRSRERASAAKQTAENK
jgi:hypothetical protein